MEEMTLSLVQTVCSYGALGAVSVYFAYKDLSVSKKTQEVNSKDAEALGELTTALEVLKAKVE